jgi:hypothetical protein
MEEGLCQRAHLDERLDFTSPCKFLLTHTSRYLTRVTLDTGNNRMWIWNFLRAFVNLLDDDNFFASLTTLEDDGNLFRGTINYNQVRFKAFRVPFRACTLKQAVRTTSNVNKLITLTFHHLEKRLGAEIADGSEIQQCRQSPTWLEYLYS